MQIFFQPIQNINLGGRLNKSEYQYTLQSNDTEALYRSRPNCATRSPRFPGLLDVTTDLYVKNPQSDGRRRPREGGGLRRLRRSSAPGALQRLRLAPGRHHLHAGQRLPGHPGDDAGISSKAERSQQHLPEDDQWHDGAALGGHAFRAHGRPAASQSPGSAAGGDHLVQSGARISRSARRSMPSPSSSATSACRRPSPPASRAPRRCSRIYCAGRAF